MEIDVMEMTATLLTVASIMVVWYWSYRQFKLMREQLEIQNKEARLQIFAEYTKRYQEIILHLPEGINDMTFSLKKLKENDREKYDRTMRYMRVYYDLCSEEYFLNEQGMIENFVWNEWKKGMTYTFNRPAFKEAWGIINTETGYYPDFSNFVNNAIK